MKAVDENLSIDSKFQAYRQQHLVCTVVSIDTNVPLSQHSERVNNSFQLVFVRSIVLHEKTTFHVMLNGGKPEMYTICCINSCPTLVGDLTKRANTLPLLSVMDAR